ncbi:S8 family serine peptidase [uncultured Actinobaculum sp.]|uniref:S8 family serine peptidase n=2 Tax=Actinobaculum TaxID=76833 RepID=UPI0028053846|nr:S8 family serine peptidase [uncultured Actinobaculum sp.]
MQRKPWWRIGASIALAALVTPAIAPVVAADETDGPGGTTQSAQAPTTDKTAQIGGIRHADPAAKAAVTDAAPEAPKTVSKAQIEERFADKPEVLEKLEKAAHDLEATPGGNEDYSRDVLEKLGLTPEDFIIFDDNTPVNVIVTLKNQPGTPSSTTEDSNVAEQNTLLAKWKDQYGLQIDRQFGYLFNGFSATMPAGKMVGLGLEPEVLSVKRERVYYPVDNGESQPAEHAARDEMGASEAYRVAGADGTGTVIAIIDSGIDPSHRDLRLDDFSKAKIQNVSKSGPFTEKVPNGFNYADQSYEIKDTGDSQHGQHVAGISAANGLNEGETFEETGRIEGVAPNAQLLAMKVFSNGGGGGASDGDIIAAIEDSVKLGADVMNLSLGSANGHYETSTGTAVAVQKAREAGVYVVMAAGNDGLNYSPGGGIDDVLGMIDDGTVGSPSTTDSALSVASINNKVSTQQAAFVNTDGEEASIPWSQQTGTADGKDYPVVSAGKGNPEGFVGDAQDLTGKIVLIERGGITFGEKFTNAEERGAAGILVYDNASEGSFLGMAGLEEITVQGGSIRRADATKIIADIEAGKTVKMRLTNGTESIPNEGAGEPSSFSSWGATSTLDFKPQISGIGGQVYSLQNDNKYTTMDGTSMASPNVTGTVAVLQDYYKDKFPGKSATETNDLLEQALANTAEIPTNAKGVPFAPRQVGAGLARVDLAAKTDVTATVEGSPWVALRQIGGPVSFKVTLTNHGTQPVGYTIPAQQVINESNAPGEDTTTVISAESLKANASTVEVPAGETREVVFTLTPDIHSGDHFIEGWARFVSATDGAPDISVPYLGFVGDWNAEPIVSAPGQDIFGIKASTNLLSKVSFLGNLPMTGMVFWLSPNGDGFFDSVFPSYLLLRNATDAEYEVLDADGNLVKKLGQEQELRRYPLGKTLAAKAQTLNNATSAAFDGKVYDPQTARDVPVADGVYTYRIKTRLGPDFEWQNTDMQFGVDATPPEISISDARDGKATVTASDATSPLVGSPTVKDPNGKKLPVTKVDVNTWEFPVENGLEYVTASIDDSGFNTAYAGKVFASRGLVVSNASAIDGQILGPSSSPVQSNGDVYIEGVIAGDIAKATVNGKEPIIFKNGQFATLVTPTEGEQTVTVVGYDAEGTEVARKALTFTYDSQPPTLDITNVNEEGQAIVGEDNTVTIEGKVTDEREGADLSVKVGVQDAEVAADGTFSATVTVSARATSVTVAARDGVNVTTRTVLLAGRKAPAPTKFTAPTYNNMECEGLTFCFIYPPQDMSNGTVTITGKINSPLSEFTITPENRANDDGTMMDPEPIPATINEDGTFEITVPLKTGVNHVRMKMVDAEGVTRLDAAVSLLADAELPTINFTEPNLVNGTLFTNKDAVTFAGAIEDDGWGYTLSINRDIVSKFFGQDSWAGGKNRQEFSHEVKVADGDRILVFASDFLDRTLASVIPVVVDKVAPEVTIDGIEQNTLLRENKTATVTAKDPNLASLRVTIDGKEVSLQETNLVGDVETVEENLTDVTESGTISTEVTTTHPDKTELTYAFDTADLAAGTHTVTVESTDLAGNVTAEAVSFHKDLAPVIEGPDQVAIEVSEDEATDQDALAAKVLEQYKVVDDGAADAEGDTTLALAPGTVLVPGTQTVNLIATDAAGVSVIRTITVDITVAAVEPKPEPTDPVEPEPTDPAEPEPTDPAEPTRPVSQHGNVYVRDSLTTGVANSVFGYGNPGEEVFFGDWDGDGVATPGVKRGHKFLLRNSNSAGVAEIEFAYGNPNDAFVVGDFDGDGKDTIAVQRGNKFFVKNSLQGGKADIAFAYGSDGDTAVAGDFDGDGKDTIAVQRGNKFFVKNSLQGGKADIAFAYGDSADFAWIADFGKGVGIAISR